MKKNAKYALMYAKNLSVPPGDPQCDTGMEEFRTFIGLLWFVIHDKAAWKALGAGRAIYIKIRNGSPIKEV
jgi:hypothetical protein